VIGVVNCRFADVSDRFAFTDVDAGLTLGADLP
jgi:hypothetical protein